MCRAVIYLRSYAADIKYIFKVCIILVGLSKLKFHLYCVGSTLQLSSNILWHMLRHWFYENKNMHVMPLQSLWIY